MRSLLIASLAASALWLGSAGSKSARADSFAIHVAGPGYHFDIGRAHGHHGHHGSHRSLYRSRYRDGRHGHRGRGHGWHADHAWHDTSHWDYHPGSSVLHYDHYHYVPGHWDFHQDGHWDHYHW